MLDFLLEIPSELSTLSTSRNNVGGEHSLGEYTGVERSGREYT